MTERWRLLIYQRRKMLGKYIWNILIAIDQLANAILGGDPDETISSRAGKQQGKTMWANVLCWFLNKLDTGHCKDAIEEDEGKDEII